MQRVSCALNAKFKQCSSAVEVEALVMGTPHSAFNDANCSAAIRRLARTRSSSQQAIGKIVSISSELPHFAPYCLGEFCKAVSSAKLLREIPAPLVNRISNANFHNVSPMHLSSMFDAFLGFQQPIPQSLLNTVVNRTFYHDFASEDVSTVLHAFASMERGLIKPPSELAKHVLQGDLTKFSSKQLCQTWYALHKLGFNSQISFTQHILQARNLQDFNTGDLIQIQPLIADNDFNTLIDKELSSRPQRVMTMDLKSTMIVSTFYKFTPIDNCGALKRHLERLGMEHDIRGTILVAPEGINATICGLREDIDTFYRTCQVTDLYCKESLALLSPFQKMMVRLKPELVAMGLPNVPVTEHTVGAYIKPQDWDAFVSHQDVVVIDTRNDYEIGLGTFDSAVNPEILRFRDFPQWFETHKADFAHKRVAMFCTGGVRCEKSTAYAKQVLELQSA
ncbi:hypothetical protein BASA81_003794 [Batrachochytrium salamandrivorans]|nr:hypothetical protein BASA81_003794 [Batrachochytrium salamandrivorans]